MTRWFQKRSEILTVRKSRQTKPSCFVLLRKSEPVNTDLEIEEIIGIYSTLKEAQHARTEAAGWGLIREYVMNPPLIKGKYSGQEIMQTCSAETDDDNPYWFEDEYADEDLDSAIEKESKNGFLIDSFLSKVKTMSL